MLCYVMLYISIIINDNINNNNNNNKAVREAAEDEAPLRRHTHGQDDHLPASPLPYYCTVVCYTILEYTR